MDIRNGTEYYLTYEVLTTVSISTLVKYFL